MTNINNSGKDPIFDEPFAQKETIDAEPGFPEDVLLERK